MGMRGPRWHVRPIAAWAVLLLVAGSPAAQTGPGGVVRGRQVFQGGVEVVHVTATVTDAGGRLVPGLARDDFEIYENDTRQTVTHFTGERVPVSLALVVDVSDSMHGQRIVHARTALGRFLIDLLDPLDEACLVTFNHAPRIVAEWTAVPSRLGGRLDDVKPFGGTALYDAILEAQPLMASRSHERAAMVVVSDGADTASDADLNRVRRGLWTSDAFIYAIAIDPPQAARSQLRVNLQALRDLTDPSGGYTEVVQDSEALGPATARIAEELNHQYMIGYTPSRAPDGTYRRIRVRVAGQSSFRVRARRGYVSTPRVPASE
jgi:Ca-activated chloride channel family protein